MVVLLMMAIDLVVRCCYASFHSEDPSGVVPLRLIVFIDLIVLLDLFDRASIWGKASI